MSTSLVIVESPSKAKVIGGYLGARYTVKSCVGHVRDIASGESKSFPALSKEELSRYKRLGILPEKDWFINFQIIAGKEKIVKDLRSLAKKADDIYLASDQDREGEAIAWHLQELLKDCKKPFKRVVFNEVTKPAILKAFENPREIDTALVDAQKARRILDRLFGFELSPVLWQKVARNLSAGRVQSPALKLLVERELEILAFNPQEFWNILAFSNVEPLQPDTKCESKILLAAKNSIDEELDEDGNHKNDEDNSSYLLKVMLDRKKNPIANQSQATEVLEQCRATSAVKITSIAKKQTQSSPQPPFITSTLQRAAGGYLRYGLTQTMSLAQKLYENGYITYMRTDSVNLSSISQAQAKEFITEKFGADYVPKSYNKYKTKQSTAQEVHEAIRPTDVSILKSDIASQLGDEAKRLYQLIWSRFVASQMTKAKFEVITANCEIAGYEGVAKGQRVLFDGFTRVWVYGKKADVLMPELKEGAEYQLNICQAKQSFTRPLPRFTESSLVKELEEKEIGRPSTYASIVTLLQDRNYVKKLTNRQLAATLLGEIVSDKITLSFDSFIDTGFTASMEKDLDEVASGNLDWKKLLDAFYNQLMQRIEIAKQDMPSLIAEPIKLSNLYCTECDSHLSLRINKQGQFLGCSNYTQCNARYLKEGGAKPSTINLDDVYFNEELKNFMPNYEDKVCQQCGSVMLSMFTEGKRIQICSRIENCGFAISHEINWAKPEVTIATFDCDTPECKGELIGKTGRFGKYFTCETCNTNRKANINDEPLPRTMAPIPIPSLLCEKNKDDHYVLREGVKGLFLSASKYPKVREARSPKVDEVKQVLDQMEARFVPMVENAPSIDKKNRELFFGKNKRGQFVAKPKEKTKEIYIWHDGSNEWLLQS